MPKQFPYLEVSGSHKKLGEAIGSTFEQQINYRIKHLKQTIKHYEKYVDLIKPYYRHTLERFPQLVEELESTARAAKVAVKDYFFLNSHEIYHRAKPSHSNYFFHNDHCTVAVSFNSDGAIIGHNEDWIKEEQSDLYILKATIKGTTFLGLQYCTELPGVSGSLNSWGLVQCVNDLNPVAQIGVPKNFLARAILECKTIDEAEKIIGKTKRASGFNHVLVQETQILNIEIAGDYVAVDSMEHQPYVHTNHYLSSHMKHRERFHSKNSEERLEIAQKTIKHHMNVNDMKELLSKTQQQKFKSSEPLETIASLIIIPKLREVRICFDPSQNTPFKIYKL